MTRRRFALGAAAAAAALGARAVAWAQANSAFRVAVITDEIADDFEHACAVAATEFGMRWVELRTLWKTNIADLGEDDVARARAILTKYGLRVTDLASPLYKVDWPGAARANPDAKVDAFQATAEFARQDAVLGRCIELARQFGTDRIRCFDFWRVKDVAPVRAAMDRTLQQAAERCRQQGIDLVLENEHECNTATASEAVRTLGAAPGLNLNWDPANAVMAGEMDAYPQGWAMLPKERIHHCHVKNVARDASGKMAWSAVGVGAIDWTAQFEALRRSGYRGAVSLETHWRGAGTREASSRASWAGMKTALAAARCL
jgi:sugar phosphate isomerase/epimerase